MKPLHKLPVLTPSAAAEAGYQSITTDICGQTEKPILASVARHRDPSRAAFILTAKDTYQLALKREDIKE